MSTNLPGLHLVAGGPAKTPRKRHPRPSTMLACPRCDGREAVQTRIGLLLMADGRVSGGTPAWVCVACLSRGERVVMA
ncbi:MAG: hypothetical protein ACYC0T_13460 [Ramlibacter sp.]